MSWLDRRRERRVLRALAAYGPCEVADLLKALPRSDRWLGTTLADMVLDGTLATSVRPFGFTAGGYTVYQFAKGK